MPADNEKHPGSNRGARGSSASGRRATPSLGTRGPDAQARCRVIEIPDGAWDLIDPCNAACAALAQHAGDCHTIGDRGAL